DHWFFGEHDFWQGQNAGGRRDSWVIVRHFVGSDFEREGNTIMFTEIRANTYGLLNEIKIVSTIMVLLCAQLTQLPCGAQAHKKETIRAERGQETSPKSDP